MGEGLVLSVIFPVSGSPLALGLLVLSESHRGPLWMFLPHPSLETATICYLILAYLVQGRGADEYSLVSWFSLGVRQMLCPWVSFVGSSPWSCPPLSGMESLLFYTLNVFLFLYYSPGIEGFYYLFPQLWYVFMCTLKGRGFFAILSASCSVGETEEQNPYGTLYLSCSCCSLLPGLYHMGGFLYSPTFSHPSWECPVWSMEGKIECSY